MVTNLEYDYISRVKASLASRELLTREEKKILGLKMSFGYHASDEQRSRIGSVGSAEAVSLLADEKENRPEIFNRLRKEIDLAFADRTSSTSTD